MSDNNQTIQAQIDRFNANDAHAAMALIQLGTILAGYIKPTTDSSARTVTTHVLVMDVPARIVAVEATTGGSTGNCLIGGAGSTLATLQVAVAYDVDGIATITFKASDAVTAAKVTYAELPLPSLPDGSTGLGTVLAHVPV